MNLQQQPKKVRAFITQHTLSWVLSSLAETRTFNLPYSDLVVPVQSYLLCDVDNLVCPSRCPVEALMQHAELLYSASLSLWYWHDSLDKKDRMYSCGCVRAEWHSSGILILYLICTTEQTWSGSIQFGCFWQSKLIWIELNQLGWTRPVCFHAIVYVVDAFRVTGILLDQFLSCASYPLFFPHNSCRETTDSGGSVFFSHLFAPICDKFFSQNTCILCVVKHVFFLLLL